MFSAQMLLSWTVTSDNSTVSLMVKHAKCIKQQDYKNIPLNAQLYCIKRLLPKLLIPQYKFSTLSNLIGKLHFVIAQSVSHWSFALIHRSTSEKTAFWMEMRKQGKFCYQVVCLPILQKPAPERLVSRNAVYQYTPWCHAYLRNTEVQTCSKMC